MRRGRGLSWSVVVGLLVAGAAWGQAQKVALTFEDQAVVANGLTPGKPVVWFGVEHRIDAELSGEMVRHYQIVTAAADGTARLDLTQAPAARSFWVAVDLGSGALGVAAPNGYPLRKPPQPAQLRAGQGSQPDQILDDHPYVMGLMVRPGVGAWAFAGGDGGPRDEDGKSDGHLRFALDKLDPLPGSPAPPSRLNGQDLWLLVDPLTMEIAVYKGGVAQ
jgi:hypothetical protein